MNNPTLFVAGSFAVIGFIVACVLLTAYMINTRPPLHCEKCGGPLNRSEWGILSYSPITGKPDRWHRWAWCSTQNNYSTPRPQPLAFMGPDEPDDLDFKDSHNVSIEYRRGLR